MKKQKEIIIDVKGLVKNFYNGSIVTNVLKDISFSINKGEFVGIMGPSGSGKSTCLYQLSLLDTPTSGSIIVNDEDIAKLSDTQKTQFRLLYIGYVFQQYKILPELTALENVMLPLQMRGEKKENFIQETKAILDKVGLQGRHNHFPSSLSGGQQQRVAIARALINKPKILFADEPTANLDTHTSDEIMELFKYFNKNLRQTIVMVSHDSDQIKYFDRVIRLVDGKITSN